MKRRQEEGLLEEEPPAKKQKYLLKCITDLPDDSMQEVTSWLGVGEILMLSMSCSALYDQVCRIVQKHNPTVSYEPWSITKAIKQTPYILRTVDNVSVLYNKVYNEKKLDVTNIRAVSEMMFKYCEDNNAVNDYDLIDILSVQTEETADVEVAKIVQTNTEEEDYLTKSLSFEFSKTVSTVQRSIPVGFHLKRLSLHDIASTHIYELLSYCRDLEELDLSKLDDSTNYHRRARAGMNWFDLTYESFNVFKVPKTGTMADVATAAKVSYKKGVGYYQLLKKESVGAKKGIVVINKKTGETASNTEARELLGISNVQPKSNLVPNMKPDYEIFVQSTSPSRKLTAGSYVLFPNLYHTKYSDSLKCNATIPLLKSLKKLCIASVYSYETDIGFAKALLQLCPNLKEFTYVYQCQTDDYFLEYLAECCPNLERVSMMGDDGATPVSNFITDNGIIKFIRMLPSLTHLELKLCGRITGKLFQRIGEVGANLQELSIERQAYNDHPPKEFHDIYFGGGVLSSLKTLDVSGELLNLKDKFYESIFTVAPHLESLSLSFNGNNYKLSKVAQYAQQLKHLRYTQSGNTNNEAEQDFKQGMDLLSKCSNLKSLDICGITPIPAEELTNYNWKSLTSLKIQGQADSDPESWVRALKNAAPKINKYQVYSWSHTSQRHITSEEGHILSAFDIKEKNNDILSQGPITPDHFVTQWLVYEPILHSSE